MKQIILPALVWAVVTASSFAQIQFKLSFSVETGRYLVSVVPQATYASPQNITGTGQGTIKVPSNEFEPVSIQNHLEGMNWEANSRNDSPEEAPDYDYISFGLIMNGIAFPEYQQGVELPLFSFQNALGCTGKVYIVDNQADPFMPPNSENANIGNTITILGAGGDAYGGVVAPNECDCNASPLATEEELGFESFKVFPNPASDFVNVQIKWNGEAAEANLVLADALGKKLIEEPLNLSAGKTSKKLDVSHLVPGGYVLYLEAEDWKINLDRISKQ